MVQKTSRMESGGWKLIPALFLASLAACTGSNTGGNGVPNMAFENDVTANDTPATANLVRIGAPIHGDLSTPGDVDVFAIDLAAGRVVQIELFATRHDQAGWSVGPNVPRLTLLDTTANEHRKLLEHDYSGNFSDGWSWGFHDLDIPMFQVPASGTYYVSVAQDDPALPGASYILRVTYASVPGLQQEAEAAGTLGVNDTAATAESIRPGTMHGFHVAGEEDWYKFTVSVPTIVRFEMTAYRNGVWAATDYYYDTEIYLFDTDGTTQVDGNDDSFFYDSAVQHRLDSAGTYYIVVDEYDSADAPYFLKYTATPVGSAREAEPNEEPAQANRIAYGQRVSGSADDGENDWFQFSGRAGDMVRLQTFDHDNALDSAGRVITYLYDSDGIVKLDVGGDGQFQTLTTILQSSGTFYVVVSGTDYPADYTIELTRFQDATYETEPNNGITEADALGTRVAGVIDVAEDQDLYSVSLGKDRLVRFVCYASNEYTGSDGCSEYSGHGSDLAPRLELLDSEGVVVATATSVPGETGVYTESVTQPLPTCALSFTAETAGAYYLRVTDAQGGSGTTHDYVIEYERR